jgi:NAD-dependent dihydropyrimidine dehydrogenase PreA subunit
MKNTRTSFGAGTESETMLFIDQDTCIDYGLCVDECQVKAIFPEADLPEEWASFIEKNAAYYE